MMITVSRWRVIVLVGIAGFYQTMWLASLGVALVWVLLAAAALGVLCGVVVGRDW